MLERDAAPAPVWRNRRWDSFTMVTPNWALRMPGASYDGPEPDRMRRCILHLAGGALDKVRPFVEAANTDYRDVIYWAEYDGDDRRERESVDVHGASFGARG